MKLACPCCEYLTLPDRNQYDICPVCFWEDDGDHPKSAANDDLTISEGKVNYQLYGAMQERFQKHVRPPLPDEIPSIS